MLKTLRAMGCPWDYRVYSNAIREGRRDVIEYAYSGGCPLDDANICFTAADHGDLDLLRLFRERGAPWDYFIFVGAILSDSVEIADYLLANGCPWNNERIVPFVVEYDKDLKWVKWTLLHMNTHYSSICKIAVMRGKLYILDYLREHYPMPDSNTLCLWAIDYPVAGDVVGWICEHGHVNKSDSSFVNRAACHGNNPALQALLENGFAVSALTVSIISTRTGFDGIKRLLRKYGHVV